MTLGFRNSEFLEMVDHEQGLVQRRIFMEQDIYQLELERIFARAWLFMCHESQIPNPGDFFQTMMGEDPSVAVELRFANELLLARGSSTWKQSASFAEAARIRSPDWDPWLELPTTAAPAVAPRSPGP